jgi:phage-related protein
MTGEVIKSFLVGLGFDVDEKSLSAFNKAINSASVRILALYGSIQAATAGIFASIASVSQGFEDMGYQLRLIAPAMNRWLVMRQAMLDAYAHAGVNLTQVVRQAILFNYSLAKTKFALEAVYKSVAAKFFPLLTKQMDIFRQKIFQNMPKIQATLMRFVEFIFKAFRATTELGTRLWSILTRVWDFFTRLDHATNGWSTAILGLVAAWKILNLSFLLTPFGAILAGLAAILVLFDDFKVWQEGGKSLFDWSAAVPVIKAVGDALSGLYDTLNSMVGVLFDVALAFRQLFHGDFSGALDALKDAGNDVLAIFTNLWGVIKNISSAIGGVGGIIGDQLVKLFGSGANPLAPGAGPAGAAKTQPLLPPGANSSQSVNQQTSIVVNGSADAHAVGKNVASQQDRVNFDMTRNLKGAMQ